MVSLQCLDTAGWETEQTTDTQVLFQSKGTSGGRLIQVRLEYCCENGDGNKLHINYFFRLQLLCLQCFDSVGWASERASGL